MLLSQPAPVSLEPIPSCRECGACCREARDGTILIHEEDLVRWRREGATAILDGLVPGHFSQMGFPARENGACVHLGVPGLPNDCTIYPTRGKTCRDFEAGSAQCRTYRRLAGIA
jgi:Fe-S-cluster containining protein